MFNHWIFRCKDITELVSRSYDEKLPLKVRVGIRMHLIVCFWCARYKKQIDIIHKAIKKFEGEDEFSFPITPLPKDAAKKIVNQLEEIDIKQES